MNANDLHYFIIFRVLKIYELNLICNFFFQKVKYIPVYIILGSYKYTRYDLQIFS